MAMVGTAPSSAPPAAPSLQCALFELRWLSGSHAAPAAYSSLAPAEQCGRASRSLKWWQAQLWEGDAGSVLLAVATPESAAEWAGALLAVWRRYTELAAAGSSAAGTSADSAHEQAAITQLGVATLAAMGTLGHEQTLAGLLSGTAAVRGAGGPGCSVLAASQSYDQPAFLLLQALRSAAAPTSGFPEPVAATALAMLACYDAVQPHSHYRIGLLLEPAAANLRALTASAKKQATLQPHQSGSSGGAAGVREPLAASSMGPADACAAGGDGFVMGKGGSGSGGDGCTVVSAALWLLDRTVRKAGVQRMRKHAAHVATKVEAAVAALPAPAAGADATDVRELTTLLASWPQAVVDILLAPTSHGPSPGAAMRAGRATLFAAQPNSASGTRVLDVLLPAMLVDAEDGGDFTGAVHAPAALASHAATLAAPGSHGLVVVLQHLCSHNLEEQLRGVVMWGTLARLCDAHILGPLRHVPIARGEGKDAGRRQGGDASGRSGMLSDPTAVQFLQEQIARLATSSKSAYMDASEGAAALGAGVAALPAATASATYLELFAALESMTRSSNRARLRAAGLKAWRYVADAAVYARAGAATGGAGGAGVMRGASAAACCPSKQAYGAAQGGMPQLRFSAESDVDMAFDPGASSSDPAAVQGARLLGLAPSLLRPAFVCLVGRRSADACLAQSLAPALEFASTAAEGGPAAPTLGEAEPDERVRCVAYNTWAYVAAQLGSECLNAAGGEAFVRVALLLPVLLPLEAARSGLSEPSDIFVRAVQWLLRRLPNPLLESSAVLPPGSGGGQCHVRALCSLELSCDSFAAEMPPLHVEALTWPEAPGHAVRPLQVYLACIACLLRIAASVGASDASGCEYAAAAALLVWQALCAAAEPWGGLQSLAEFVARHEGHAYMSALRDLLDAASNVGVNRAARATCDAAARAAVRHWRHRFAPGTSTGHVGSVSASPGSAVHRNATASEGASDVIMRDSTGEGTGAVLPHAGSLRGNAADCRAAGSIDPWASEEDDIQQVPLPKSPHAWDEESDAATGWAHEAASMLPRLYVGGEEELGEEDDSEDGEDDDGDDVEGDVASAATSQGPRAARGSDAEEVLNGSERSAHAGHHQARLPASGVRAAATGTAAAFSAPGCDDSVLADDEASRSPATRGAGVVRTALFAAAQRTSCVTTGHPVGTRRAATSAARSIANTDSELQATNEPPTAHLATPMAGGFQQAAAAAQTATEIQDVSRHEDAPAAALEPTAAMLTAKRASSIGHASGQSAAEAAGGEPPAKRSRNKRTRLYSYDEEDEDDDERTVAGSTRGASQPRHQGAIHAPSARLPVVGGAAAAADADMEYWALGSGAGGRGKAEDDADMRSATPPVAPVLIDHRREGGSSSTRARFRLRSSAGRVAGAATPGVLPLASSAAATELVPTSAIAMANISSQRSSAAEPRAQPFTTASPGHGAAAEAAEPEAQEASVPPAGAVEAGGHAAAAASQQAQVLQAFARLPPAERLALLQQLQAQAQGAAPDAASGAGE
jgi:hypothetical protein